MNRPRRSCDLLIRGSVVLTMDDDRRVMQPGSVAVTGDRIVAVGKDDQLEDYEPVRTIEGTDKVVLPGFVDCHNHLFQSLARGLGEGLSLWPWLCEFMWPYAAQISAEEARCAATLAAIEAARAGTTSIVDNHYAPSDVDATLGIADAIEQVGLRGAVARGITGPMSGVAISNGLPDFLFQYSDDEEIDMTRACIDARPPGGRVVVWPAPLNVAYVNQDLLRRSVDLARELGTNWHCHCSESQADPQMYLDAYGIRPVDWLYGEGLLGTDATLAHAMWLSEKEIEEIGETSTGVSYNPISNQYIGAGPLPLRGLRDAGAVIGIGTDGPACGHRQDMLECMKQSILVQRMHTLDPTASRSEEALELATREGARYMDIEAGVLAPGKLADLTIIDLDRPHMRPFHRAVSTLAYSAHASDVWMTIVDGEVIYEDGRCLRIDEASAMEEAQSRAEELVKRSGMQHLLTPWREDDPGTGAKVPQEGR